MPKTLYKLSEKCLIEKNTLKNFGSTKEQNMGELLKNFARRKTLKFTQQMSETKAAFAERAIQSLKHTIYRYIEDHGEKFVPKLQLCVSLLNCRKNRSIGKSPRDVKNSNFLSILYNKPFMKYTKPKFKLGDRVRISKIDNPFRKRYKPQFTDRIFEISAKSTKTPATYIIRDLEKEESLGKVYEK